MAGAQASDSVGSRCFATFPEELEHGDADVDCVGVEVRVELQELREEAAISVAQNECAATVEELWEIVEAAVFEGFAEGEVFEPAIGASDEIKVGFIGADRRHPGTRAMTGDKVEVGLGGPH